MKLLIVSHACSTVLNQELYAEIQKQTGWQITLVVPEGWKDEFGNVATARLLAGFSAELLPIPVFGSGSIIFHFYRCRFTALLQQEQFDAIYINHEPYALATAQVVWANARTLQAPVGFYSCQNIVKHYPPPFSWLERMVYRHSQFAFPITEAVNGVLQRKGFHGETALAPLPFNPEIYRPRLPEENQLKIPRQEDEMVIGFVGRLVEAKGLRTLAIALGQLQDLTWRLILVGNGDYEPEFRRLIGEQDLSGRVAYLGFIPHAETPAYLAAMDILVLPSETRKNWKEQFGRVIPEALACDTAVVGSDSGEIPRLISDSRGGLIFPEGDAAAFALALRKLILAPDERRSMAARGRAWAVENLSTNKVATTMATTIEKVVAKTKKHRETSHS